MVLERLSCLNHASFHLLTVARRGSCGPTKKLIFLHSHCCSCAPSKRCRFEVSTDTWFQKPGSFLNGQQVGPIEEDGGDKRLVELEVACKADGVALLDPV